MFAQMRKGKNADTARSEMFLLCVAELDTDAAGSAMSLFRVERLYRRLKMKRVERPFLAERGRPPPCDARPAQIDPKMTAALLQGGHSTIVIDAAAVPTYPQVRGLYRRH